MFIKEDFINSPTFNTLTAIWSDETKELFESSLLQKKELLKKEAEKAFKTARYADSMVLYQRLVRLDGENEELLTKIFLSECRAKSIDEINEPFTKLDSYGALIKICSPKTKEQLQVCDDNIKKRYLLTLEIELRGKNFSSAIKTANAIFRNWQNEDKALMAMVFAQHKASNLDELLQLEVSVKSSKLGNLAYQNGSAELRTRIDEHEKKLKLIKAKKEAQSKKKKRIALITTSICLAVILISVLIWFLTLERVEGFEFESVDGGYAVVKYTGSDSEVVIPKTFRGKPVVTIYRYAFYDCKGLTSITIPDSVTNIDERAFYNCAGLTSITIPNSVTSIGMYAFSNCKRLANIKIPDSIAYVGEKAFSNCTSLTSISFPDSVTDIGYGAFNGCTNLTNIDIPNSVKSIGKVTFDGCTNIEEATIPTWIAPLIPKKSLKNVTLIGEGDIDYGMFRDCTSLTSISIGDSVTSIGSNAFNGCTGLTSISIGDSVTSIGDWAFENCTSLASVTIGDSVTSIGNSAFYNCAGLTSINIPNSVTSIGNSAFSGCTGLTSINIPNGVTSIGSWAFYGCTSLTIYCKAKSEPSGWSTYWNGDNRSVVWGHKN